MSNSRRGQDDSISGFVSLLFENDRRIYAYIYVLVVDQTEADDLFQDTVTIMWEKFDTFQSDGDFGAWGIGIAYNLVRNYRRKKARSRLQLEEDIEQLIQNETKNILMSDHNYRCRREALQQCLSKLNPNDRKILTLKYRDNISTSLIAEKIGCSIKVVYLKVAQLNEILFRCIKRTMIEINV